MKRNAQRFIKNQVKDRTPKGKTIMTDFNDYIDTIKIEFHERFRYLLEVNTQLEQRIITLEEYIDNLIAKDELQQTRYMQDTRN